MWMVQRSTLYKGFSEGEILLFGMLQDTPSCGWLGLKGEIGSGLVGFSRGINY
jgi:hypothetical protein